MGARAPPGQYGRTIVRGGYKWAEGGDAARSRITLRSLV